MRVFKEIGDIFAERGLVVFGNEYIISLQPMHSSTQRPLGIQGIQAENAPFDQFGRQKELEFTDFIVFLLHIAMPQHSTHCHLVATELMNGMLLRTRGSNGFVING